jgi:hypothetical protein
MNSVWWDSELVVFTAGLEDYAQPIINEMHRRYNCFPKELRLYRPATTPCAIYSCVKVVPLSFLRVIKLP